MSEKFDEDDPRAAPPPAPPSSRRSRALIITAVVLIGSFFAITTFAAVYTDRLWYQSAGYGNVFSTLLWTRIGLFAVFGVLMALAVGVNIYLAYRFRPFFATPSVEQNNLDRYRSAITPIRTLLMVGISVLVGAFAGASGMGQWRTFLLWRNGGDFPGTDPYFKKNIGYYVFDLPWQHYLVDYAMAAAMVGLIAAVITQYLYGGIRLQVANDRLTGAAQAQISVLLGLFVLAKGADYYLDRFDLVTQDNRLFTGMNFTADNAVLPAKNILIGVALICAVLFFLNVWRRTWQLPGMGLALLALSSVLLGMIWPAIVQQFQVKPSEADKEESYIQANIDATRAAYDLTDVKPKPYTATPQGDAALAGLTGQTSMVPVVDPKQVRATFEQRQQARAYYTVAPVLDVDRYTIDGVETPVVLGVRELDQAGINAADQNWSNLHTVYTHGEGVIAADANEITESISGDRLVWAEGIEAGQDKLGDYERRIYFGESSPDYSIVGKASEKSNSVELGLANTDTEQDQTTTYTGEGGVDIGGNFRQFMYAVKYGEPNFLLSGRVNSNSELLYNRTPAERVEKVAPWLTIDTDAHPAVVEGRVQWILDGYTTTDKYPNAQRESFDAMIDDALQDETPGLQTLPTDEVNYMRSAVKATVDAYDGTVKLYAWDEEDPMLQAWEGAFPGTVESKDSIPEELLPHLRYPEDLFKVQRYQLARYHVTDAGDFYQGNNRWEVPEDPNVKKSQPPYRLFVNQTGEPNGTPAWGLTSVFVPRDKSNLASFVSVNSDATSEDYGKFELLELDDANAPGPGQIANEMSQDEGVGEALQRFRVPGSTPPIFGNLLTLPVEDGLVYMEPVYAVRPGSTSSFPILQYVIVSYNGKVGIGTNLVQALADSLGVSTTAPPPTDPTPDPEPGPGPGGPRLTLDQQIQEKLQQADTAFTQAEAAQRAGDSVEWARLMEKGRKLISDALSLANQRDGAAPDTDAPADAENAGDTAN